jgi:hypothetical protein
MFVSGETYEIFAIGESVGTFVTGERSVVYMGILKCLYQVGEIKLFVWWKV